MLFTIFSIATASTADNPSGQERVSVGQDIIAEQEDAAPTDEGMNIFEVTPATIIFNFIMLLASTYFGMLFSNFGFMNTGEAYDVAYLNESFTFWVKIIAQWLTLALFVVSFSLNICMPDRVL